MSEGGGTVELERLAKMADAEASEADMYAANNETSGLLLSRAIRHRDEAEDWRTIAAILRGAAPVREGAVEGVAWFNGDAFCSDNGEEGEPCQRSYTFVPECEHEPAAKMELSAEMRRATLYIHDSDPIPEGRRE